MANEADAFTIFEVLNDRGLDLSVADLLKNFLFKQAGDRVSEAQTSWVSITSVLEALGERDVIKIFIRHVWSSQHGLTREKDLYDAIRKQIISKQTAITFLKDLEQKAKIYAALGNPGHEYWKQHGSTVSQAIEALGTLRTIQIRPLVIAVLSSFDQKELRRSLPMLVAWTVRFLIVGASGSGPLETNYSERAKEVSDGTIKTASALWKAMQQIVPQDDRFREEFARTTVSTQYLARYYLGVIEVYQRGVTGEIIVNPSEEKVTLEHILPQTPSSDWAHFSREEQETYYRRLGNLTLLDKKLNEKAGNISFAQKCQVVAQSNIQMTRDLASMTAWTVQAIEERQKRLADVAVKVWDARPQT